MWLTGREWRGAPPERLDKARENEDKERDERRRQTIRAERAYDELLDEGEIKREQDADERERLEHAAQELVKDDYFKRGEDEYDAVEQDAKLGERHAKEARILARRNCVAVGETLGCAEKRCAVQCILREIY